MLIRLCNMFFAKNNVSQNLIACYGDCEGRVTVQSCNINVMKGHN